MVVFPQRYIFLTVFSVTKFGDTLREANTHFFQAEQGEPWPIHFAWGF